MEAKFFENAVKIKWNNEMKFFEAFMPNGDKIPHSLEISFRDNFGSDKIRRGGAITATINLFVNIE